MSRDLAGAPDNPSAAGAAGAGPDRPRRSAGAGVPWPDLGAGLFVVALGGLALWQALVIPTSPIYAQVGPKAVPFVVAGGLLLLGAGLVYEALRGGWSHGLEEARDASPVNWRAFTLLLAGLLANLLLIGRSASRSPRPCNSCWSRRPSGRGGSSGTRRSRWR